MNSISRRPPGYDVATEAKMPESVKDAIRQRVFPVLMTGPVGTGKTCSAAVWYGSFRRLPMWNRADDLLLSIVNGRQGGIEFECTDGTINADVLGITRRTIPFNTFVNRVVNASCLFLDDLGARKPTENMQAAMFDLLEWRKEKPLCITSNLNREQLFSQFGDRVADRILSGTVIRFEGESQRTKRPVVSANL